MNNFPRLDLMMNVQLNILNLHLLSLISVNAIKAWTSPTFIYFSLIQIFSISFSAPSTFLSPFPFISPSVPSSPAPPPSLLDISVCQLNTTQGIHRPHAVFAWNDSCPLSLFPRCQLIRIGDRTARPCDMFRQTDVSVVHTLHKDCHGFCVMYGKCHCCGEDVAACTNI